MNLAFIVQARMGSTRLPHKILRPFYGEKSILDLLVEKLKFISDVNIIIATSQSSENDVIEDFCKRGNIICYRGDENDVLKRFIDAAENNNIDNIIRVCSDNPFLELFSIKRLVEIAKYSKSDYISFNIEGVPSIKTHYGFWTEFTTLSTLKRVYELTEERLYHEHVTNYIYTHPEKFNIEWIQGPDCLKENKNIRLTIDTEEDFKNAQFIYQNICKDNPNPRISEIVNFLNSHRELYNQMVEQIKKNSK